jgi:ADP-ribosylglycohydrolase
MPDPKHLSRIRASALWAAYGDALGFMTELADTAGIRRRGIQLPVREPKAWKRRIGGRFGPTVELPAGCLSDDTQLRLAVCRSIRGDGKFDVEIFAKVELPVWASYALGAGRGSQEAAAHLRKRNVSWATNFFDGKRISYTDAGGNGAAMRVQPHIWAASKNARTEHWMTDVIVDSVCTHGHMRGILGAAFHAGCLRYALINGQPPGPDEWRELAADLERTPELVKMHEQLDHLWLTLWQRRSERDIGAVVDDTVDEIRREIDACMPRSNSQVGAYRDAVERLEAFRPDQRGSGTKTALLGALAAWLFPHDPGEAVRVCANQLGTDTDSIATMAGAIGGATVDELPDGPIADRTYIEREAERMWAISAESRTPNFPYPSLVGWTAPKALLDSIGTRPGEDLVIAGLGPARRLTDIPGNSEDRNAAWSWLELWFGQRILAKHRPHPTPLPSSQTVESTQSYVTTSLLDALPQAAPATPASNVSAPQADGDEEQHETTGTTRIEQTMHQITDDIISGGFDPHAVGLALLELADRDDGIERAGDYAAIIAKAHLSRRDRSRRASSS